MSFTCNDCGTSGSTHWMDTHNCDGVQSVREFGGHCEDYPCCGHAPGECEPREEYTKAYWLDRYADGDFDSDDFDYNY